MEELIDHQTDINFENTKNIKESLILNEASLKLWK